MTIVEGHPALQDPWEAALYPGGGVVLAVLTATHGPAYRDAGVAMAILPDHRYAGAITSGCIEADLILQADRIRDGAPAPRNLRYGEGSPFFDLRLPCGGAVEVMLFGLRDRAVLQALSTARQQRRPVSLRITPDGRLHLDPWRATGRKGRDFIIGFRPVIRFAIFGAGPEASVFASLTRNMGYDQILASHDDTSLRAARALGCRTHRLQHHLGDPAALGIDADTAAVLFYHDHDYEPEILRGLVVTPAFYIGAQGSRATQQNRLQHLRELGLPDTGLARIRGPIGLIPSSRDPKSLAISVLAEIIGLHNEIGRSGENP